MKEHRTKLTEVIFLRQTNADIRKAVAGRGFTLWQLAATLGITDSTLSRKLRMELSQAEKARMMAAVEEMEKRFGGEAK